MKTKKDIKTETTFAERMREIRDKINFDIKDMDSQQLKNYLKSKRTLHKASIWKTTD